MNFKDILIFISMLLVFFLIGLLFGWIWHKNTTKPIFIDVPADTVYVTQWKTNTIVKQKQIQKQIQVVEWKQIPVYVFTIVDTIYNNTYQYPSFYSSQVVQNLSFKVDVDTNVKTYVDTTYNNSYISFQQNVRVKDFIVKYNPVQVKVIQNKNKIDNFELYGNLGFLYKQNEIGRDDYILPLFSISGVIRQRYKFDVGIDSERGYYFGLGTRLFNF